MWEVALSTMWAIGRFGRLEEFFSAAWQLGFRRFELNHEVNSRMLSQIDLKNGYRVMSVHEPCPADVPTAVLRDRHWLVSAVDEECRQQGVRAVQRSIDLAQELGARIIVVHTGCVDVDMQLERELRDLFRAGQAGTPRYAEAKERLVAARAARVGANLDAARRSMVELAAYAGRAGIRLGVENRYHYLDIPLLDEMDELLMTVDDGQIGFWYDVGHAQALENLGFDRHEEWLRRYASRMVGAHLHDIKGIDDHFAAGLGEVDWDMVAASLPEDALRTCEFRPHNTPEQVLDGVRFLAEKGCLTCLSC